MTEQQTAVGQCGQCQGEITLIMPPFRIMNSPEVSIIAMSHEKAQICKQCGAGYVPVVKGILADGRLDIQWSKVDYTQKPLIVPASQQEQRTVEKTKGLVVP